MKNIKTLLIALVVSVAVVGAVELLRKPVDTDALATEAAKKVNIPEAIKGEQGVRGLTGLAGKDGKDGVNGVNGKDGKDATFDEVAFAKKYGLTVVVEPFTTVFTGSGDKVVAFSVPKDSDYKFTITSFVSTNDPDLKVVVYDGFTPKGTISLTTFGEEDAPFELDKGDYTFVVQSSNSWKVVVKED